MTVRSIAPVIRGFRKAIPDATPARIEALLYLSQAWVLGLTGQRFFPSDFIVDVDAGTMAVAESRVIDVKTVLRRKETAVIKALVSFYRNHTDDQLRALIRENVSRIICDGDLHEIHGRIVVTEEGVRWTHPLK